MARPVYTAGPSANPPWSDSSRFVNRAAGTPAEAPSDEFVQVGRSGSADEAGKAANTGKTAKTGKPVKRRSLIGKILRLTGFTTAALVTASLGLGIVGYVGNRQALEHRPEIHRYEELPAYQVPTGRLTDVPAEHDRQTARAAAAPTSVKAPPDAVTIVVPGDTLKTFVCDVQNSPEAGKILTQKLSEARGSVEKALAEVRLPDKTNLVDLTLPLPTGEHNFLHLGSVDLPSLGYRSLATEAVPLTFGYHLDPVATGLTVKLDQVQSEHPPLPEGVKEAVYLGGIRLSVHAPAEGIPVAGNLKVQLDLEGKAARQELSRVKERLARLPAGDPGRERVEAMKVALEQRLQQTGKLQRMGAEQGFTGLLQDAFHGQEADFVARVKAGEGPLMQSTFHLWLVPDRTGDGRADLALARSDDLSHLDRLQVELERLDPAVDPPPGTLPEFLNRQVEQHFLAGVRGALPKVTELLRHKASEKVAGELTARTPGLEQQANALLGKLYAAGQGVDLPTRTSVSNPVGVRLGKVELDGRGNVVVSFSTGQEGGASAHAQGLRSGQLGLDISGQAFNEQLRRSVDWNELLSQARQKAGLQELSFPKDAKGKTVLPQLTMLEGKPAIGFEVVVRLKGLEPVQTGTGAVTGVTGALDGGAAEVQKGLGKHLGVPGEIVGGILRAPTFLVDKVAGAGKAVVDNTVGKVVDPIPEVATRGTIHTRVTLPFEIAVEDGAAKFVPLTDQVKLSRAGTSLPFDVLDILPTRLITTWLAQTVAEAQGGSAVGEHLNLGQRLNLVGYGVRFDKVEARPGPGGVPDFSARMSLNPTAAHRCAEELGKPSG